MPSWCDMLCPDARWPEDEALDGAGSCRTFIAVYCEKYKRLNKKNAPCIDLTEAASPKPGAKRKSRPRTKAAKKS